MGTFKSIQLKTMLAMILVAALSSWVIHAAYQAWLIEITSSALQARLERALYSFDEYMPADTVERVRMVQFTRRFELEGAGILVPGNTEFSCAVGLNAAFQESLLSRFSSASRAGHTDDVFDDEEERIWGMRSVAIDSSGKPRILIVSINRSSGTVSRSDLDQMLWITLGGSLFIIILLSYLLRRTVVRPVEKLSAAMMKVSEGDLNHVVSLNIDKELVNLASSFNLMLDDLRRNRQKVAEHEEFLNEKIEEIRADLEEKEAELIQTAKLASVGQLAAGVAHEINNPLHYIMLTGGLLEQDARDEASRKRIHEVVSQAKRCRRIVSDLLEYSRRDAAPDSSFDLTTLVEQYIKELDSVETKKEFSIVKHLDGCMPPARGTVGEIRRVLENIFSNAIYAIPQNGGIITVTTESTETGVVKVVISDNGDGMSAETLERALEAFYTTKEVGEGTGLGLSIAYGIVTRHRGNLRLLSTPGHGTEVQVELPAQLENKDPD